MSGATPGRTCINLRFCLATGWQAHVYGVGCRALDAGVTRLFLPNVDAQKIKTIALQHKVNFHYPAKGGVCLSVDESTRDEDIEKLIAIFTEVKQSAILKAVPSIQNFVRSSSFLQHPVFVL